MPLLQLMKLWDCPPDDSAPCKKARKALSKFEGKEKAQLKKDGNYCRMEADSDHGDEEGEK